jgi:hypothetical protein
MMVKLHTPTMINNIDGDWRTMVAHWRKSGAAPAGFAFIGASQLQQDADEIKRNLETPVQGEPQDPTGKRLSAAVQRKLGPRSAAFKATAATASADEPSFAEKLNEAIAKKLKSRPNSQQSHTDRAQRGGERYRPLQRRVRTKSD